MLRRKSLNILYVLFVLFVLPACRKEIVPRAFFPRSDYEAYQHSLEQANLIHTALGRDWLEAGLRVMKTPVDIRLPHEEAIYLDPKKADAAAYRFFVKKGLRVELEIFVQAADKEQRRLKFEPRRDSYYVLRLQAELLRGGQFRVLIRERASIGFPVKGKDSSAIASFFGDPRDGGSREHHGVDIFAARFTPVLAPSKSSVTRVGEGEIGGKYVWLYDSRRSMYLYFAHLETCEVAQGDQVLAGQQIGTVGNTGNARSTPPHLHFGIYQNGPIDPYFLISLPHLLKRCCSFYSVFVFGVFFK